MDKFFLEHNVMKDRDPDEPRGRCFSDSEASDDEQEITEHIHSVNDPTGPWARRAVDGPWGHSKKSVGVKKQDFKSQHTGPKGVIKDYKTHKKYLREERVRKENIRQMTLSRIANGTVTLRAQPSVGVQEVCDDGCNDHSDDDDSDDDLGLLDDEFLLKYRQLRVDQIHQEAYTQASASTTHDSVARVLEFVSPTEFVDYLNATESHERSLIHLYHPENYKCHLLNQHLGRLIASFPSIRFLALPAKEADDSIEMEDLPVLMIYHGSVLYETVMDLSQELDGEFTSDRIQKYLRGKFGA